MATTTRRASTPGAKPRPARKRNSRELVNTLRPNQTPEAATAKLVVAGLANNAILTINASAFPFGDVDVTECLKAIVDAAERVNRGDLADVEALLLAQATTLNALFSQLAHRGQKNMGEHLDAADRYMRLALKAQSQCRATVETLAAMKNPPTVFAKQANIAHGPQQVNNGLPLAHAEISDSEPNKLLEAQGERLELGAAGATGAGDPPLATVGTRHRTEND